MANDTAISRVTNILTAPSEAFRAMKERPTWLLPLAAVLASACAVTIWYYNVVDIPWMMEQSILQAAPDMPRDQIEQQLQAVSSLPAPLMAGISAGASAAFVVFILLLAAGYLFLVSMATNDGISFKRWFSLVSWSTFPVVLGSIASMVNLALNDATFMPPEALNPLTFWNLLGYESGSGPGARAMQFLDVTSIWSTALMTYGYSLWTRKSVAVSFLIVAGPLLVIVLIMAALATL